MRNNKNHIKRNPNQHHMAGPAPEEIAAVQSLQPQLANLRSNIGLLGKAFNVRTQTGFKFAHIVLSLRQHLDQLRNTDDGHGEVDRRPGGRYRLPACLLRKFRSDQPSLANRKKAMPKILVVDDNRIHLACAVYSLRKNFLPENVFCATNGREALEIMEHVVIDAIFVDTDMPTMNGLEMADVVRHVETNIMEQREFRTLIVGMLTPPQSQNEELLTECMVAGMDRFCVKPLSVHMHAVLDAVTMGGSTVEGFRRKALELQWISRHPQLQAALFGKVSSDRPAAASGRSGECNSDGEATMITMMSGAANNNSQLMIESAEDRRRAQDTALTLAPDLQDERAMLQLVEKDLRLTVEDIFARERRDDTERMQHATALLRDRIEDLERTLASVTGGTRKTLESLHVETIARLEKQAEEQRLQIMRLSVRNRELTQRNEKLEEDMRQIIRHGANNARTVRAAFRFIGHVQKKMEKFEQQTMALEDRSAQLGWQNYYGNHFQGTSGRRPLEMPEAAEDFSSSWYHEQMQETHRITARSNEACASAVVMLGELIDHINLVRPDMFGISINGAAGGVVSQESSMTATPTLSATPTIQQQQPQPQQQHNAGDSPVVTPFTQLKRDDTTIFSLENNNNNNGNNHNQNPLIALAPEPSSNVSAVHRHQHQQASAWKLLHRDMETVIHTLSSMLMQNIKDLHEGTKRNIAAFCLRELELWTRLARVDREPDLRQVLAVPPKVQDEIHAIVERMTAAKCATQRRSATTQTDGFEVPPWVTDGDGFDSLSVASGGRLGRGRSNTLGDNDSTSFMTDLKSLGGDSSDYASSAFSGTMKSNKQQQQQQGGSKDWTFAALVNKLRPIVTFEGYVPLDVRNAAFEKIVSSIFRLERKQLIELGDSTKRLIREARNTYNSVETAGDERGKVLLLGDVSNRSTLAFREVLQILSNVTDNLPGIVDAVIVHTLKSIEPSSGSARQTKERLLAVALLEALEATDMLPPPTCPWGEPALMHKVRASESWDALEKGFGVSLIEMRRLNADNAALDFDAAGPEPGLIIKLPSRPDYIRSKFATLYHPKTTMSKSGLGARARPAGGSQHQSSRSHNAGEFSMMVPSHSGILGSSVSRNSGVLGGMLSAPSGGGMGAASRSHSRLGGASSRMVSNPSFHGNPRGRTSGFIGGTSAMNTRAPSRMVAGPSFVNRRRDSVTADALQHVSQRIVDVGTSQQRRTNARVAAAALNKSTNKKKNSAATTDAGEITIAVPSGADGSTNSRGVSNSNNNNSRDNSAKKLREYEFTVPVTVLATEAPKTVAELAREFGVDENTIRSANPQTICSNGELAVGASLNIPVSPKFVTKSLTEARDEQLLEAMQKMSSAALAASVAADAERKLAQSTRRHENGDKGGESPEVAAERHVSTSAIAAHAARESALAADHAAALHRALMDHLEQLAEHEAVRRASAAESHGGSAVGKDSGNNSGRERSLVESASDLLTGIDMLRRTSLAKVTVELPVQEETSFERLAVLYGIRNEDLVQANPTLRNPILAGAVLKVPVNIEEWRSRVEATAAEQYKKNKPPSPGPMPVADGLQQLDSMIMMTDGADSDDGKVQSRTALLHDQQNVWSREEKALFASVQAALKQRELVVRVEHRESEYGVTLSTIINEYNCCGGMLPSVAEERAAAAAAVEKKRGSVKKSDSNVGSESITTPPQSETQSRRKSSCSDYEGPQQPSASAIAAVTAEIAKLNQDSGAVIRDDDDDSSVNPNAVLIVPVPLAGILPRLVGHALDLQKRSMDLLASAMQDLSAANAADASINFFGEEVPDILETSSRGGSFRLQPPQKGASASAAGAAAAAAMAAFASASAASAGAGGMNLAGVTLVNDNETIVSKGSMRKKRDSSMTGAGTGGAADALSDSAMQQIQQQLAEVSQMQEYVQNHMQCAAELLEVYCSEMALKLRPPETANIAVMTDNISSILSGSRLGASQITFGDQTQHKIRTVSNDPESERQRQLAAVAVLLGVDDISDVPAALRNAKLSQVATTFLDKMKTMYGGSGIGGTSTGMSTSLSSRAQQSQHPRVSQGLGLINAAAAAQHAHFSGSSPQVKIFGGGAAENLLVVGQQAGRGGPDGAAASAMIGASGRSAGVGYGAGAEGQRLMRGSAVGPAVRRQLSSLSGHGGGAHDLLRQRMARLGFRTSAEALYGDTEALALLHSSAPLVENMLRVQRVTNHSQQQFAPSPSDRFSERQLVTNDYAESPAVDLNGDLAQMQIGNVMRSSPQHVPARYQHLQQSYNPAASSAGPASQPRQRASPQVRRQDSSSQVQSVAPTFASGIFDRQQQQLFPAQQVWAGSSAIGARSAAVAQPANMMSMTKLQHQMQQSPLPPKLRGEQQKQQAPQQIEEQIATVVDVFAGSVSKSVADIGLLDQQQQQPKVATQFSPVPPAAHLAAGVASPRSGLSATAQAVSLRHHLGRNPAAHAQNKRIATMYAEDTNKNIDAFTSRLRQITGEYENADSNDISHSNNNVGGASGDHTGMTSASSARRKSPTSPLIAERIEDSVRSPFRPPVLSTLQTSIKPSEASVL